MGRLKWGGGEKGGGGGRKGHQCMTMLAMEHGPSHSVCYSYFSLRKLFMSLVMSFTYLHTCWPLTDIAYEDLEGSVLGGFLRESITTDDIAGRFVQQYLADLLHVHFRLTPQEHEVSDHVSFCLCDRIKHVCSQFI